MDLPDSFRRSAPHLAANVEESRTQATRYDVHGVLGRGGMAIVYEATERATGRRLALKRLQLQADPQKRRRDAELFEREFHALSHLAHPRIVEVFDYGLDASGPYYTMELLSGGDLSQLAPLPWQRACSIGRDLCSALSLLHSRRLVHRDLSPRNVRCTEDGFAKLIDFGALASAGPSKLVVGTAPCCAPESVSLQALDGRTDLFALGATLYFMLVGRHAYSARHFSALGDAWRAGFSPPSELVADIPEALEALVLDLLRLEPDARPANAAEVFERLSAVDGESHSEQLQVAQAYLQLPGLVGRGALLQQVRSKFERAARGHGCTLVIEGTAGVGRSRMLDACLLEATLIGTVAVRADADDAASGDYGVMRSITRQLMTIAPAVTAESASIDNVLLGHAIPELCELAPPNTLGRAAPAGEQLQIAVLAWLTRLTQRLRVVIAVDDFQRIDSPSAALLSLLAREASTPLCLLISIETGAASVSPAAQKLLLQSASRLPLGNLSQQDSELLLKGLFGEVPNIGTFAHRLYELSLGNARDLMRLAQHLVDQRVARYEAGAWALALRIDEAGLPSSMADALQTRLQTLDATSRELAGAFALCPDQSFEFEECGLLWGEHDQSGLLSALDQLLEADIVRRVDDRFVLSRGIWVQAIRAQMSPAMERTLQARLALVLSNRGLDFRAGQHWLHAGEDDRALDVLVAHARTSQEQTAKGSEIFLRYARLLPPDWFETYDRALQLCDKLQRPKAEAFTLRGRLIGILAALRVPDHGHTATLLARLKRDSGLEDWEALDPSLEPTARISQALERARARHAAASEHERWHAPPQAMPLLARALSSAVPRVAFELDVPLLRSMPVLTPFASISPACAAVSQLVAGMDARYSGRPELACTIYRGWLERAAQPDRAGLDVGYVETSRLAVMTAIGAMEACMGLASSLTWAAQIGSHTANRLNALQTRVLYHTYIGDVEAADQDKKQVETLRLQTLQLYERPALVWELGAHVIAEDLTRLRHAIEQLTPLAQSHPQWQPVHLYALAEYQRIRRDARQALPAIESAMALVSPGVHPLWASIASSHVSVLDDLGGRDQALEVAARYVEAAQRAELGYVSEHLSLAMGLCAARAGRSDAGQIVDASIARLQALGIQGLELGFAHETRARVALCARDQTMFVEHAELCGAVYGKHKHPALLAKYRRLWQQAENRERSAARQSDDATEGHVTTALRLVEAIEHCKDNEQRGRLALSILIRESGAQAGLFFILGEHGPECCAVVGEIALEPEMLPRVRAYLDAHSQEAPTTATGAALDEQPAVIVWSDKVGLTYRPVLLGHHNASTLSIVGLALLAVPDTSHFTYPAEVATAVSRCWAESGYSSALLRTEQD